MRLQRWMTKIRFEQSKGLLNRLASMRKGVGSYLENQLNAVERCVRDCARMERIQRILS